MPPSSRDRERLRGLLAAHSVRHGDFVLASGRRSRFFIDCKATVLRAEGHALVGPLLLEAIGSLPGQPVAVAGVVLGGCPLASAVAVASVTKGGGLDAVYVRKATKDHGSQQKIEGAGHLAQGAPMAVVEDTVTTGGSTLRAVVELRAAGFDVVGVAAVVDRLEGAQEAFAEASLPFVSLFTKNDFTWSETRAGLEEAGSE